MSLLAREVRQEVVATLPLLTGLAFLQFQCAQEFVQVLGRPGHTQFHATSIPGSSGHLPNVSVKRTSFFADDHLCPERLCMVRPCEFPHRLANSGQQMLQTSQPPKSLRI